MKALVFACLMLPQAVFCAQPTKPADQQDVEARSSVTGESFRPAFFEIGRPVKDYVVNNPASVYQWLKREAAAVSGAPDKYSSAEDRRKYRDALRSALADYRLPLLSTGCVGEYASDKQAFPIRLISGEVPDEAVKAFGGAESRAIYMTRNRVSTTTETAQNSYGVKFDVERRVDTVFAVAFPGQSTHSPVAIKEPELGYGYKSPIATYRFMLPMSSDEARTQEKNLACLLVIRPEAPVVFQYQEFSSAAMDKPVDQTNNIKVIYGAWERLYVVNTKTNEVYAKYHAEGVQ